MHTGHPFSPLTVMNDRYRLSTLLALLEAAPPEDNARRSLLLVLACIADLGLEQVRREKETAERESDLWLEYGYLRFVVNGLASEHGLAVEVPSPDDFEEHTASGTPTVRQQYNDRRTALRDNPDDMLRRIAEAIKIVAELPDTVRDHVRQHLTQAHHSHVSAVTMDIAKMERLERVAQAITAGRQNVSLALREAGLPDENLCPIE